MSNEDKKPTFKKPGEAQQPPDPNADMRAYFAYWTFKHNNPTPRSSGGIYADVKERYYGRKDN